MKTIFYNSKIAKAITFLKGFATIMLFGFIFTEHCELPKSTLAHEAVHQEQYRTCFTLGLAVSVSMLFALLALGIQSWWMLLLISIPALLYYAWYLMEYCIRFFICLFQTKDIHKANDKAYKEIAFEQEAYDLQFEYLKPCREQRRCYSFSWFKYYR